MTDGMMSHEENTKATKAGSLILLGCTICFVGDKYFLFLLCCVVPLLWLLCRHGVFDPTSPCSPATLLLLTKIFGARSLNFEGGKSLAFEGGKAYWKAWSCQLLIFPFWKPGRLVSLDVLQCCEDTCSVPGHMIIWILSFCLCQT